MKKIFYIILFGAFLLSSNLFAQRLKWEDSFDSKAIFLNGWRYINNDGGGADIDFYPAIEFFGVGPQSPEAGDNFLKLGFESVNRFNRIDDWIITPKLFGIHAGDSISFWCGAIDRNFKDSLKVWISTTDNNIGSFTLLDYFKVDGPVGSWHKKSYDLTAYAGKDIYFAVNYYMVDAGPLSPSADNVWIDHFKLTGKGFGSIEPESFKLYQNFPNPFNPNTDITFSIAADSKVLLKIYSITGEEVSILANGNYTRGTYSINFDASGLASGVYFYKLTAGSFTDEKKMVLVK